MPYINYKSEEGSKPFYKLGLDVIGRSFVAGMMCAIIFISLHALFFGMFSETVGYTLQRQDDEGRFVTVEEVTFDEKITSLPTELPDNERAIPVEAWSESGKRTYNIVAQVFMGLLYLVMIYTVIWTCGDRDRSLVQFGHITRDKLKGVKAGIVAAVPSFVTYLVFIVIQIAKINIDFNGVYALLNIPFKPYIDMILNNGFAWYDSVLLLLIPVGLIIFYSFAVYEIGYRQILISEKIIYKEN